jgi:hypothetical protein
MKIKRFYSNFFLVIIILFCSISYSQNIQNNQKVLSKIQSENLTRLGNWPFGSAIAVAVDTTRNIVYLSSGGAVLILDVSDITNPQLLSDDIKTVGLVLDLSYNPEKKHLYIAAKYEGFQIWDVNEPTAPQLLLVYEFPDPLNPPVYNVDYFENFVILDVTFVASIDVTDLNNPLYVGADASMGYTHGIHVDAEGNVHSTGDQTYVKLKLQPDGSFTGLYTYLNDLFAYPVFGVPDAAFVGDVQYLYIINTQSHINPLWSYIYVGDSYDIYVQGDYAFLTVGYQLKIYNVANYQNPYFEGFCTLPGYPYKLEVIDEYAYVADGFGGLRNINVHRPSEPIEVGFYDTFSAASDMQRSGDYGFVAEMEDGLLVFNLTDLSNPTLVGQYNTPGISKSFEVEGNYTYIADRSGGLRIADITNPMNPVEVGFYDSLYSAEEICVSNNYAYVVDDILNEPDWIRAINISDPANPFQVGAILMQSDVNALDVSGNFLFAATTNTGLRIIDISNPANPVEVGLFSAPNVYDVCVRDEYAYIAASDYNGGFITLNISDPINPVFVSTFNRNGSLHPFDIALAGDYAYVTDPVYDIFLMLYVGDPAQPSELGEFRLSGDLFNVYAQDSLVYICDGRAGLHIFKNELYATPGGGITWQQQNSGTNNDLWSVSFINTTTGWAAGNNGIIVKTTDGGEVWLQKQSGNTNELFSIFFIDENTGWAAGREGTILKSTDGGEDWQPQVTNTINVFRSVYFVDSNTGWAVGQNGTILKSTNGGENWQTQTSGITDYLYEVYFADNNNGWVGCQDDGNILRTTNGGTNWQLVTTPSQSSIYSIFFIDPSTGWISTSDAEIYKSTDGGTSWFEQYHDQSLQYLVFTDNCFLNSNEGWVVGSYGKIISTSDGGNSWEEQTSGVSSYLTSVDFVDHDNGWVVGKEGMILKSFPGNVTEIDGNESEINANTPSEFALFENYPNPFNPVTTISFQIPKSCCVSLKIYDVIGTEIATLVSENLPAGKYEYNWDASNLASGVYFYRLQGENFTSTKKMVLLR